MGTFRIEIEAVGGHGCQREMKDGFVVSGCGLSGCPDCAARLFVAELKAQYNTLSLARIVHWPGQVGEVIDDLLTGVRKGSF